MSHDDPREKKAYETALVTREHVSPLDLPRLSLIIHYRGGAEVLPIAPRARLVVGRVPEADISIPEPTLSRQHARVESLGDALWVEDLGSSNGTRVNGELIERKRLAPGDEIGLGNVIISVHAPATFTRGLEHAAQFRLALEEEVTRAGTFGHQFALVMVRADGRPPADWRIRVRQTLRSVDRVAHYDDEVIAVLMPETIRASAKQRAHAILGAAKGLRCVVAAFPSDGRTAAELLSLCEHGLAQSDGVNPLLTCGAIEPPSETSLPPVDAPFVRGQAMRKVYETAERVARAPTPILIVGETGSGKEVIARAIHDAGPRARLTMHSINCGAIPRELVTSTLFGHEKGTFTGAHERRKGVFEEAHGSTLLLDEVGELPPEAQVALLRVLETGRITRLGSTREIPVDVRVLSATHRDLEAMCEAGTFRRDLLFRLNTITINVPPLRQRTDEIEALARSFVDGACRHAGLRRKRITADGVSAMQRYQWPGNVRELRNAMERAVLVAGSEEIGVNDLPERVRAANAQSLDGRALVRPNDPTPHQENPTVEGSRGAVDFKALVREFEQAVLTRALDVAGWNKTHAARNLRMPLRTLMHKVAAYDLKRNPEPNSTMKMLIIDETVDESFKDQVRTFESKLLETALEAADGNRAQAARDLGFPLSTLLYKLRHYELES